MAFRVRALALVLGFVSPLVTSCAGSTTTESGDGDSNGDGDTGGDGDSCPSPGDGPQINHGILGACDVDADCAAVSITDDACYSPGCEIPIAASTADMACNSCLVEWNGLTAPSTSDECTFVNNGGDVACPAGCAVPPTCIHAYCDAGECKVSLSQDGSDCRGEAP
jgi:hypothetical protein